MATGADRMRRHRDRRAAGVEIVPSEVDEQLVTALVSGGFLSANDTDNRAALAQALARLHRAYCLQQLGYLTP